MVKFAVMTVGSQEESVISQYCPDCSFDILQTQSAKLRPTTYQVFAGAIANRKKANWAVYFQVTLSKGTERQ